ncbi:hypothetical protein CAPTEDRAFT_221373 [Capitella teleta]|uniref:CCDC92/74 N-terminal domain-containing protein n=1 Tax=Capitella teleta TaxID=283909 RepID=R7UWN7_CAPTE|nr:hypothetical protein CAPTEDRAFT_221373 [Capitella teleta]|eukprot:ELU07821.1 hypothetical protein CAPTEDRAFT_221373 [Capitella teleta]
MDLKTIKQNYDCQILFIQQDHTKTLKGLHEEIQNLQKRCSDLTFQVAMDNTSAPQEGKITRRCEELEAEMAGKDGRIVSMQEEIEHKDQEIRTLKHQLRAQERKYTDELKGRKAKMDAMNRELETKAGVVARLVTELHSVKSKLKDSTKSLDSSLSSEGSFASSLDPSSNLVPRPPLKDVPKMRRRQSTSDTIPAIKSRSASGRHIDTDGVPDPTPFLVLSREGSVLDPSAVSRRLPLPPISVCHGRGKPATLSAAAGGVPPEFKGQISPSPELHGLLAVDKIAKVNVRRAPPHDYRSSDC